MVWTKQENKLTSSIKFDSKYFKEKIKFLDALVYKDHKNHLVTTLDVKTN